jgi:16S rRNA (cytosine967-C5)-methyltransferase
LNLSVSVERVDIPALFVNPDVLSLAEQVIRRADREHPADAVLRLELKAQHGLSREDAAQVSRMVFSYFRWRGWLEEQPAFSDRIARASQLAEEFTAHPDRFLDSELIDRAVPPWVRDEIQITPAFARALQREPRLWLRARPGQGRLLARHLDDCRTFGSGPLSDTLQYLGRKDLFRTTEFHAGDFELQDLSSQAVGLVCAPQPGDTWWDACAGEGGKMLHLSDLMANRGLIWASDRAEWRLRKLKHRAARAKAFNYRTTTWDGGPKLPTKTKFDGVLIDAPCSGTGTWQRNPHARWTLIPEDIKELSEVQSELLAHASSAVKAGGKLVYSVCSLARSETIEVVEKFEARCPNFTPLLATSPLDANSAPDARLFLWPQQFGGNGMFIAAWIRQSEEVKVGSTED